MKYQDKLTIATYQSVKNNNFFNSSTEREIDACMMSPTIKLWLPTGTCNPLWFRSHFQIRQTLTRKRIKGNFQTKIKLKFLAGLTSTLVFSDEQVHCSKI